MTAIGAGGVSIASVKFSTKFQKQFKKIPPEIKKLVPEKLKDLLKKPFPSGLKFEKLKGCNKPDVYTVHVTGNYKISMQIEGDTAILRRIGNHNNIDRTP